MASGLLISHSKRVILRVAYRVCPYESDDDCGSDEAEKGERWLDPAVGFCSVTVRVEEEGEEDDDGWRAVGDAVVPHLTG